MSLRASEYGELIFAGVAAVAGASLGVLLPFVGIPVAAMALGWLAYRRGYIVSAVVALIATALTVPILGSWIPVVFIGPALLVCGPLAAWVLTRWPALRVIAVITVAMFAAVVLLQALLAGLEGHTLIAQQRIDAKQASDVAIAIVKSSGSADTRVLKTLATEYATRIYLLWPTSFAYVAMLVAAITVPVLSRTGRALGRTVNRLPALADLDLSLHIVWPAIAGLGLVAAALFLKQPNGLLWAIGANLLWITRAPLFAQGLGDFAAFYRKAKVGRLGRAFGFTFLTVSEVFIPSVSVVGLVDLFANLRRLPRGGAAPSAGLDGGSGSV